MRWTLGELAAAACGSVDERLEGEAVTGVAIDSRRVGSGTVFVALRGERVDGHDYASNAMHAGAAAVVVERAVDGVPRERQIMVDDAVAALGRVASAWRDRLSKGGCRVIAVAGSNGKTSTRHLIWGLLNGRRVRRPTGETATADPASWSMGVLVGTEAEASFNNHLGVPLTLLGASGEDGFVVCEIGTNAPGEIAALSAIARPDAVVLTSIGAEHLEGFGDLAGVAREEGAILAHVREGGLVVTDRQALRAIAEHHAMPEHLMWIRVTGADEDPADGEMPDLSVDRIETIESGTLFRVGMWQDLAGWCRLPPDGWFVPQQGRWAAQAAAMGLAIGQWLGVDATQLRHGLAAATGMPGRMERLEFATGDGRPTVVWHDAYNANPDSMAAALAHVESLGGPPWLLVLGDMLELGEASDNEHGRVRRRVESMRRRGAIERVAWVGEAMGGARDDASVHAIAESIGPGDAVLLKGSRGVRLERVIDRLRARWGEPRSSVDGLGTGGPAGSGVVLDR